MRCEKVIGRSVDGDAVDLVSSFDGVDDILPFSGLTEDGVLTIKVWSRAVGDEEL